MQLWRIWSQNLKEQFGSHTLFSVFCLRIVVWGWSCPHWTFAHDIILMPVLNKINKFVDDCIQRQCIFVENTVYIWIICSKDNLSLGYKNTAPSAKDLYFMSPTLVDTAGFILLVLRINAFCKPMGILETSQLVAKQKQHSIT